MSSLIYSPLCPKRMDWSPLYPDHAISERQGVEFADIGCGYGGLLGKIVDDGSAAICSPSL